MSRDAPPDSGGAPRPRDAGDGLERAMQRMRAQKEQARALRTEPPISAPVPVAAPPPAPQGKAGPDMADVPRRAPTPAPDMGRVTDAVPAAPDPVPPLAQADDHEGSGSPEPLVVPVVATAQHDTPALTAAAADAPRPALQRPGTDIAAILAGRLAPLGAVGPQTSARPAPQPSAPRPQTPMGLIDRIGLGLRLAARRMVVLLLILSLALSVQSLRTIAATPGVAPLIDAGQDRIAAAMDRAMARAATPERVIDRLWVLVEAPDRNWVAIDAVMGLAEERGIFLPADLLATIGAAQDADESLLASASGCLACMADPAACQLSAQLLCQAPMILTPAGDIAAVGTEAYAYATGAEVDRINLALGIVGLGATVAILATGGTSATVKVGVGAVRTARGMGLVSARLGRMLTRAADDGVDWARLRGLSLAQLTDRSELARLVRPAALAPVRETALALGRIDGAVGSRATLHLLRHVDDAAEARRIANAAEVLGPRTVGRMEILGKSRFLRATERVSNLTLQLFGGLIAALVSLAALLGSAGSSLALRLLRRRLHRGLARI